MDFFSFLLQTPTSHPGPPPEGGGLSSIIMIAAMLGLFYFLMIRPQQKKAKEEKAYRESLKKGKKVVTIGGIYGTIVDIADTTVDLLIAPKVIITIRKDAISMDSSNGLDSKDETVLKEDNKKEN